MNKTPKLRKRQALVMTTPHPQSHPEFDEVLRLIDTARAHAVTAVNTMLIELFWGIGEHITNLMLADGWGKETVEALATYRYRTPLASPLGIYSERSSFFATYRQQVRLSNAGSRIELGPRSAHPEPPQT